MENSHLLHKADVGLCPSVLPTCSFQTHSHTREGVSVARPPVKVEERFLRAASDLLFSPYTCFRSFKGSAICQFHGPPPVLRSAASAHNCRRAHRARQKPVKCYGRTGGNHQGEGGLWGVGGAQGVLLVRVSPRLSEEDKCEVFGSEGEWSALSTAR